MRPRKFQGTFSYFRQAELGQIVLHETHPTIADQRSSRREYWSGQGNRLSFSPGQGVEGVLGPWLHILRLLF